METYGSGRAAGQAAGLLVVGDGLAGTALDDGDVAATQGLAIGVGDGIGHVRPA